MRVLVLDNYDSFTYNLVQYLGELGAEIEVVRNDHSTVDELLVFRIHVEVSRGSMRLEYSATHRLWQTPLDIGQGLLWGAAGLPR